MSDITINVDGKTYDLDDFELGELEWLEDYVGKPLNDADGMNSMRAAVGFVYLIKRKDDPSFSIEDARKVKLAVLEAADIEEGAKDVKRPPTKRAARR